MNIMELRVFIILSVCIFTHTNRMVICGSTYNQLKSINYTEKELSDRVEYCFKRKPYYFSDYVSRKKFDRIIDYKKLLNIGALKFKENPHKDLYTKKLFFVPYVTNKKGYTKNNYNPYVLNRLSQRGYALISRFVDKPVKGIYISIIYDPDQIKFTHHFSQVLEPCEIEFNFYNRKKLEIINECAQPLRWRA